MLHCFSCWLIDVMLTSQYWCHIITRPLFVLLLLQGCQGQLNIYPGGGESSDEMSPRSQKSASFTNHAFAAPTVHLSSAPSTPPFPSHAKGLTPQVDTSQPAVDFTQEIDLKPAAKRLKKQQDFPTIKPPSADRPHDVFISYAEEDRNAVAKPLYDALVNRGRHPFFDGDATPYGETIPDHIARALNHARMGIFILSPDFIAKKWPMHELDYFLKRCNQDQQPGEAPPWLFPIFYRGLTLEDCTGDYQLLLENEECKKAFMCHNFEKRMHRGETSYEQVAKLLEHLQSSRGVVAEDHVSSRGAIAVPMLANSIVKYLDVPPPTRQGAGQTRLRDYMGYFQRLPEGQYIHRYQENAQIAHDLEATDKCIIHGPSGSGKSTLAFYYANDHRDAQQVIWFVPADSQEKLKTALQHIAQERGIDYQAIAQEYKTESNQYLQKLSRAVYKTLHGQSAFLILDNAEDPKLVEDCDVYRYSDRIKLIITTRNVAKLRSYAAYRVMLADFTQEEGHTYVANRLRSYKDRFPNEARLRKDTQTLLNEIGRLPKKLELAVAYIGEKTRLCVQDYITKLQAVKRSANEAQPEVYPQVKLGLDELTTQSQLVMRHSTQLDAGLIPLPLLGALLGKLDSEKLDTILNPLERLSLIRMVLDDKNTPIGIQIHQEVQDSCRYYRGWFEEASASKVALLERLANVLTKRMPLVESSPSNRWVLVGQYAPQATQVLREAPEVLGNTPEIATLLLRLGQYREAIDCAYPQALVYQEQALVMLQALYPGQDHPDIASALYNVGSAYKALGEVQKGLEYKEQALVMRKALYPDQNHPDVARSLNDVGTAYQVLGKVQKGLEYKEQALMMRKALYPDQNHPDVARSLNGVGVAYHALGEVQKGLAYQEQALMMLQALYPDQNHPDVASALNNVGIAYEALGKVQKGLAYQEQVLVMRKALYPDQDHPHVASTLYNVGSAYLALGEVQKGLEYKKQALVMWQALYPGQNHPDVASALNSVGSAYLALSEVQKGLKYKEQALVMRKALYPGQNHPDVASALNNVGSAYLALGEVQKGLAYQEQALVMRKALYPNQNHPDVASTLNNVGSAYHALGEVQKGLEYKEQALMMLQALYPAQNHPDVASTLNNVGSTYHGLGEVQKGLEYKEQALVMYQALYSGQKHPDIAMSLNNVGVAYQALGEVQKGLAYQEQALMMLQALYPDQNHPDVASALNNVGVTYEVLGEVSKGASYQEQALLMRKALYPGQKSSGHSHIAQ